MADSYDIYQICPQCNGEGVIATTEVTEEEGDAEPGITTIECPMCEGDGEVIWGRMVK